MTTVDAAKLAGKLTQGERMALLSLPAKDPGGLSDDTWWAYYAIIDAGLSTSSGDFTMVPTPLGDAVIRHLADAAPAC